MALQNINNKQATTTLDGAINSSVTSLTSIDAASTAGFPDAPFPVLIDSELLEVTSIGTGKNWTVVRGYGGTTAASHSSGADVVFKVTAEWFNDVETLLPRYDPPPASPDSDDDEFEGSSLSGWTEQHAGNAATWTVDNGLLTIEAPAESGTYLKTQHKALPGSGDWEYEMRVHSQNFLAGNYMKPALLCLTEGTTSQKVIMFGCTYVAEPMMTADILTNYSTFSSGPLRLSFIDIAATGIWLRIAKSGSNYLFKGSLDGDHWTTHLTTTLSFTPANIGIGMVVENATYAAYSNIEHFRRIS